MLDSYTAAMCTNSWVRASYARAIIELLADVELIDTIMVVVPKFMGEGSSPVATGSLNTTPLAEKINNLERQMLDEKLMLVDDQGLPVDFRDHVPSIQINFRTLITPGGNGADVVVSMESLSIVNKRLSNTVYIFFLGKRAAYPVVENYINNTWSKLYLVKSMMTKDSYTAAMCTNSWVRASYARAIVELRADVELIDIIMVVVSKFVGVQVGPNVGFKRTKQDYRHVSQKNSASKSSKKKQSRLSRKEVAKKGESCGMVSFIHRSSPVVTGSLNTTPLTENINNLKRQMLDGMLMLVDDDGKLINKVDYASVNSDSASDVEVTYDETTKFIASGGANDASLYKDEDYDIYDTYNVEGLTKQELTFCDRMDINLRGRSVFLKNENIFTLVCKLEKKIKEAFVYVCRREEEMKEMCLFFLLISANEKMKRKKDYANRNGDQSCEEECFDSMWPRIPNTTDEILLFLKVYCWCLVSFIRFSCVVSFFDTVDDNVFNIGSTQEYTSNFEESIARRERSSTDVQILGDGNNVSTRLSSEGHDMVDISAVHVLRIFDRFRNTGSNILGSDSMSQAADDNLLNDGSIQEDIPISEANVGKHEAPSADVQQAVTDGSIQEDIPILEENVGTREALSTDVQILGNGGNVSTRLSTGGHDVVPYYGSDSNLHKRGCLHSLSTGSSLEESVQPETMRARASAINDCSTLGTQRTQNIRQPRPLQSKMYNQPSSSTNVPRRSLIRDEVANRMRNFEGHDEDTQNPEIVEGLIHALDEHNGLVRLFKTARDRCSAGEIPRFKIRLYNKGGICGYELPTFDILGGIVFEDGPNSRTDFDVDEIQNYIVGHFVCPFEACRRIFEFRIHRREPVVQILNVRLENAQRVTFRERERLDIIVNTPDKKKTTLTEWYIYNNENTDGRHLTYLDLPSEFVWYPNSKSWRRRVFRTKKSIGRLTYVHPNSGELFYFRMLLCHQKECKSPIEVRTVNGKTFLWKTIISSLSSQGKFVLAVASSDVVLKHWTEHLEISWMRLKLFLEENSGIGRRLSANPASKKCVAKEELIHVSIAESYLWLHFKICKLKENMRLLRPGLSNEERQRFKFFAKWLLDVGNGEIGKPDEDNDEDSSWITVPQQYCLTPGEHGLLKLIDFIYDDATLKAPTASTLREKVIVCPKNDTADTVNAKILSAVKSATKTYLSKDKAIPIGRETSEIELLYPMEYLNTLTFPGFPPHELQLKVGSPIMLLRNVNLSGGLCNGKESEFPKHHFKFTAYNQLQSKVPYRDEDSKVIYPILTDYLGCICSISDVIPSGNGNIGQNGNVVELTTWDDLAKQFKKDEIEQLLRPIIIIVSSCRVTKYKDVQLETAPATFYYINLQTKEAADAYIMFKEKYEFNPPLQVSIYRYVDPEQKKTRYRQTLYTLLQQDPTSFKKLVKRSEAILAHSSWRNSKQHIKPNYLLKW
nr:DNA helicase [Tanacetum cinerariifolium]